MFLKYILSVFFASIFLWMTSSGGNAANIATAGQDDGYSGHILDKITRKWKPPHPLGKYRLNIVLAIEGDGSLADCRIQKSSGIDALDVSACAAARAAAPFGQPPYGMPASVFFSFWSDNDNTPRTKPDPVAPDALIAQRERVASQEAREKAQAAAETAAKKTGRKLDLPAQKENVADGKNDAKKEASIAHTTPSRQPIVSEYAQEEKQNTPLPVSGMGVKSDRKAYAKYIARLRWDLRNAMYIPKETKPGKYQALVEIKCDKDGRILSSKMLKKTGDRLLDKFVMQGIERAGSVVPPPEGFGDTHKIDFTLVR